MTASRRKISSLGEEGLIRRIAARIPKSGSVVKGIGDDCAVLRMPGATNLLLFASDMLVEGVHFTSKASASAIGWKALAVNVSDIAAMGGIPRYAVISLGLPTATPVAFVDHLYEGLQRCAKKFGADLVGGDTNQARHLIIDVAILGEVEPHRVVYRSGAKMADTLFVTGRLGGAVRSGRHLTFSPRYREARALGEQVKLHAMMDLSDGLATDCARLCRASDVAAELETDSLPRHKGCSLQQALTDGEDFELLFTVAEDQAQKLVQWAKHHLRCGLHRIGRIVQRRQGPLITMVSNRGKQIPLSLHGFEHFSKT